MDFDQGIKVLRYAIEDDRDDLLHREWCAHLPLLKKYMTFQQYKDLATGANIDMRPTEVILAELQEKFGEEF